MLKYIVRRILWLIPIIIGVIVIVFTINFFTTGSPAIGILGAAATPENIAATEHEWGLDRPYFVQLGEYLWNVLTKFDFGVSYSYKRPVTEIIGERIGTTVTLGIFSVIVTVVLGIPLGILAATKQNTAFDYSATTLAIILAAFPSFWLALMLILLFSVKLGWLPISGLGSWKHWILPVVTSGLFPMANIFRMTRSSVLECIRQDYVRTARSKGIPERRVLWKHILPNGMIPVATSVGLMAGFAMTGTIIIESIFNIPGLGLLLNGAIGKYDYNLMRGVVVVSAIMICGCNLITDVVYAFLDPRIRAIYENSGRKRAVKRRTRTEAEKPTETEVSANA